MHRIQAGDTAWPHRELLCFQNSSSMPRGIIPPLQGSWAFFMTGFPCSNPPACPILQPLGWNKLVLSKLSGCRKGNRQIQQTTTTSISDSISDKFWSTNGKPRIGRQGGSCHREGICGLSTKACSHPTLSKTPKSSPKGSMCQTPLCSAIPWRNSRTKPMLSVLPSSRFPFSSLPLAPIYQTHMHKLQAINI